MSVKKIIKEYFSVRAGKVNSVLNIPVKKLQPDDIHSLRVNIKKIRALISLSDLAKDKEPPKSLKSLKRLFSIAGDLREVQLRAQVIKAKNVDNQLSNYLYYLNLRVHYEKTNLEGEIKATLVETGTPLSTLKNKLVKVGKKQIKAFEKEGSKKKHEILKKKKVSSEELHDLRKQLKKEMYLHEALGDKISADPGDKKTAQMLGDWHDCHVMAADIKKDLETVKLPASEIRLLKKMAREYVTKANSLQSLLINQKFNLVN